MPVALVMSGTAVRPCSDEVWVSMTWRALVRVAARVALNSWRSVCRGGEGVAHHMMMSACKRHVSANEMGWIRERVPRSDFGCLSSALTILLGSGHRGVKTERRTRGATDHCSHGTSSSPTYTWNHDFLGFFSEKVTRIYTPCRGSIDIGAEGSTTT